MEPDIFEIFNLQTNDIKPKKGRILISEPFSDDSMFKRSVVLITEYSEKGATGFVLNKSIENEKVINMMKEEFQGKSVNISYGGPVAVEYIFFLYFATENLVEGSVEIMSGIYMGGDYQQMRKLVLSGELSADKVRLFGGYSGWETNQLEREIKENYWLVKNITPEEVIAIDENIWTNQINQLEEKYKMWTLIPEDPILN